MSNTTFKKKFRRRLALKTDYKKRKAMIKSKTPRLTVRKTNKHIIAQIIEFELNGDKTTIGFNSKKLEKQGIKGNNRMVAYLTGYSIAQIAEKKNVKKVIFDISRQTAHSKGKLFATLKGALDGGLEIAHSPEILPSDEIIIGKNKELFEKTKGAITN